MVKLYSHMNRESFERLSDSKKQIIERANHAVYNRELSATDFFSICRRVLTVEEFNSLFTEAVEPTETVEQEDIKTEYIEDIMQYSGVDLKEEADNIMKEAENNVHFNQYDNREDKNSKIETLFNPVLFQDFVVRVAEHKQTNITPEGLYLVFQVMKRKIIDFVERLDVVSKMRVESGLKDYNFKIENEVSKQLWYLNEMEKSLEDRLMVKKEDDSKKKKVVQEREDLIIKKKQSSSVAMAAMGIEQKSWMIGDGMKNSEDVSKFTPVYSPFDERGFDNKIRNRSITMKDFVYVLERDRRYNKSVFLIQYYFK